MNNEPNSPTVDGLNENGLQKMNLLTVRIFDVQRGCVTTQLLDMFLTSGRNGGTAAAIFERIDEKMTEKEIPWINYVGFGVDNANVNNGKHNSIKTRVLEKKSPSIFHGLRMSYFSQHCTFSLCKIQCSYRV